MPMADDMDHQMVYTSVQNKLLFHSAFNQGPF